MEIKFVAEDVVELESLNSLFTTHPQTSWRDTQGIEHNCQANWTGPNVRSGFWQSLVEWVGILNIGGIPVSIATGLIANYLWALIQRGRGDLESKSLADTTSSAQVSSPPFKGLTSAKFVLIAEATQVEINPLTVDFKTLEILVFSFFDDKDTSKVQNSGDS